MTYITYTIKQAYGDHRCYITDENQQAAVEALTGAKTLTRKAAGGLKSLGISLEYHGDVGYENDPIYPHGDHYRADLENNQ